MKFKLMPFLSIILLSIGLVACSAESGSGKKESDVLIAYNNPPLWANWEAIQKEFQVKEGVRVPADNKNSGQAITALIAEKSSPIADVAYFGIVFGEEAIKKDVVEGYKPPLFDEIPDDLKDAEGRWMSIHYGAISFIVNTDALGDTPIPQSWDDLLKPEYSGKVGFLDPSSAAIGYSVLTAANIAMGGDLENWDPGFEYLKKLEENNAIHPKQTANAKVMKGEIPILIDADFNGYKMKYDDNAPIEVVIPEEGSLKVPYIISLVKNSPHSDAGKKYIDFIVSDEGQKLFAGGYVRPIRDVEISQEAKDKFLPDEDYERVKSVDFLKMNEVQDGIIKRWMDEIIN